MSDLRIYLLQVEHHGHGTAVRARDSRCLSSAVERWNTRHIKNFGAIQYFGDGNNNLPECILSTGSIIVFAHKPYRVCYYYLRIQGPLTGSPEKSGAYPDRQSPQF